MTFPDIPSLRQLRAFEAAARLESVSDAAREISLSQPALTQSLHGLETRLRVRLFERRRTGCYVTGFGEILLRRVRRFFDHIRLALAEPAVGAPFTGRLGVDTIVNKLTRPQLRCLIAVAGNESFEGAARTLGIAEPSLHRSAKELERELRRSLYRRTASGMTTTAQGTELARRFQLALREIEYGLDEIRAAQGEIVARLAIGNIPHSDHQMLSAALNELLRSHPSTRVQVIDGHYEALLNDLRNGKLDFLYGVLRRPDWVADVQEEPLFLNQYVVVGRKDHPLAALKALSLRDLLRYDWIMPGASTPRQQALERLFVRMAEQPRISIETTSMQICRAILAGTDRLILMSRAESQLNDTALTVLPFRSPHLRRVDGVATRADWQPTNIHRQFLDLLRQQAARSAGVARGLVAPQSPRRQATDRKSARRKIPREAGRSAKMSVR